MKLENLLIIFLSLILISCEQYEKITVIHTKEISEVTHNTATIRGDLIDVGKGVTNYGHCWSSTNQNPSPDNCDGKTTLGSTNDFGSFISYMKSLKPNTLYYVSAYASNVNGSLMGEVSTFTTSSFTIGSNQIIDIDYNIYNTITIGTQVWMKENLKTTKYRNGDVIGTTTPLALDIDNESAPKYQWAPEDDASKIEAYGRLYTWYAATDSRNICPTGWHIPTNNDWTILSKYVGYVSKDLAATSGWKNSDVVGTPGYDQASNNSSGFTALPVGVRASNGGHSDFGNSSDFWSSSSYSTGHSYANGFMFNMNGIQLGVTYAEDGFTVRCIKD